MFNPVSIISIIISVSLFIILFFNNSFKSKIIRYSFIIYLIIFLLLIILFDNLFIYDFLKSVITYILYPDYLLFVITILFSIIILLLTLFNNKIKIINKILNYIIFVIAFSCYNIFISFDIDTTIYSELYQNKSLITMRVMTISMLLWIIINIILKIRGKYEK